MAKSKKPKYVGTCGMYLIVGQGDGKHWVLVHRRSKQVSDKYKVATPGGIVPRAAVVSQGDSFDAGAKDTAVTELREETGIKLSDDQVQTLQPLPVHGNPYFGANTHRNFGVWLGDFPPVTGPEKDSEHELYKNGMENIGRDAGDGYHAWVELEELLSLQDLMPSCRIPLLFIAEQISHEVGEGSSGPDLAWGQQGVATEVGEGSSGPDLAWGQQGVATEEVPSWPFWGGWYPQEAPSWPWWAGWYESGPPAKRSRYSIEFAHGW